jgi:formamidopyrimidine-DNA glycosylase
MAVHCSVVLIIIKKTLPESRVPELPEVETTRRGIEPHILGKKVTQVIIRQPMLRWPVSPELGQGLTGQRIDRVERRSKYLFLVTERGRVMIHLGMSGSLRVLTNHVEAEKHDHADFVLSNGRILRFRDPRRFGSIFWLFEQQSHVLLDNLGPEPLLDEFSADYLYRRSRGRKVAIKQFIMNAQVVVGVGNIYANESLFLAGIRPGIAASRISRRRYGLLVTTIKQVLERAIKAGGTTLRDFVQEDGSPGYFQQSLNVYGRGGAQCLRCGTVLREIRQGGRSTVFCANCQKG